MIRNSLMIPFNISLLCSGHGFKLSPVIGKVLSEMALGLPPSYDLTLFRLDRFSSDGDNWNTLMT